MKRRDFLKYTLLLSVDLNRGGLEAAISKLRNNNKYVFPFLAVSGDYKTIGYKTGQYFKQNFKAVINGRKSWHDKLMRVSQSRKGKQVSGELLRITNKYFPHHIQEIEGISEGTGIHFNHLWAMSIKSELLVLYKEPAGCSTIALNKDNILWLLHNEDGHEAYSGQMFLLKVTPPSGVSYLSMVYPGTLTGNGPSMNDRGIVQTTNYISSTRAETGIPRYVIGRAILEAESLKEAVEIATIKPRTFPYHHNLGGFSEKKYMSVETVPDKESVREPEHLYFHTNHLISGLEKEFLFQNNTYIKDSSRSRFQVIRTEIEKFKDQPVTREQLLKILSSHQNAPYSPCRHPQGEVKGTTLGTSFIDIRKGTFQIYRGNPCQAVKEKQNSVLSFD